MGISRQFVTVSMPPPIPANPKPDATAIGNMPQGIQPSAAATKRGPKPSGSAKRLISLRLDPDVIDGFKETGDGWQSRINEALRRHLGP